MNSRIKATAVVGTVMFLAALALLAVSLVSAAPRAQEPGLVIEKTSDPMKVYPGEQKTYHIRVTNEGESTIDSVLVTDTLPAAVDYEIDSDNCTLITQNPDVLQCDLGSMDPGESSSFDISVLVLQGTPPGLITNSATANFVVTDTATNLVLDPIAADLSINKGLDYCWGGDGGDRECVAGGTAGFYIDVRNDGPITAESVVVEDLLPAGVTVESVSPTSGSCTTGIPGDPLAPLTCNLGDIPPGEWRYIDIQVQIDPDYVDAELPWDYRELENDALVRSDTYDPDNDNNRDHVIIDVYTYSELAIQKWGFPDEVVPGEEMEYEIRVRNVGPSTVDMLHFVDLLPDGVTYLDYWIEQGTGTCTYHESLPWAWWEDYRGVHCYLDEIPPNGINMVHLQVLVNADLGPDPDFYDVCNIIPDDDPLYSSNDYDEDMPQDEWFMPGWFADSYIEIPWEWSYIENEGEYFGWCPDEVFLEADLSIQKTSEPMKVYPSEQKVYHIEVTNNGPAEAPDVIVTDTLPSAVHYEIDNDNCNLVTQDPDVLECHLGTIPPGQTAGFDISALVDPLAPAVEITNTAVVSMPYDINPGNNTAWATNLVLEPIMADLELQKTASTSSPTAGTSMNFILLVTNHGPVAAENVVVEDMLPEGLTVQSVSPGPWSCTTGTPGSEPLRCNLGTLAVNAPATVVVTVGIDPDYVGTLENDAVVFSDTHDQNNSNNRDFVIVNVTAYSSVFLKKGCGFEEEVLAGEEIQYDILVRNNGPSTVHNFQLWDLLPDDVTYLSYEILPGGGQCFYTPHLPPMHGGDGPGLHCYLGDVAPYETRIVYIIARVNPDAPEGELTNRVTDWDAESSFSLLPPAPSNRECSNIVVNRADLSIRKTADPYKVFAGDQVRYDVSVTNNGPGTANDVVVLDTLDPNVEYEIDTDDCEIVYTEAVTTPTMFGSTQPSGGGGVLFSTDLVSGTGTFIGQMPDYLAPEIEYDNTSGRLFASMGFRPWYYDYEEGPPRLYELDRNTGASLGYVELEEWCALPGLEFVDGTLYGTCSYNQGAGPDLVTIDPDTGDMGYVGYTYLDDMVHGLAYEESSATMYGLTVGYTNTLVTIDLSSGLATPQCVISDTLYGSPAYDLRAIEFGPDGTLYGGIASDSDLVEIDPTAYYADGEWWCDMTHIGDTGFSVTGLTLQNEMPASVGLECSLDDIPPGETSTFSIWVQVKPDALPGMINNTVRVWSETQDPNGGNNRDSEANLVLGRADLRVQKFGKPEGEVRAGDKLTYTVIVDNLGTGYAHDVTLDDVMESNGSFDLLGVTSARDMLCDEVAGTFVNELLFTCVLTDPLEVKGPAPGSGRWMLTITVQANEPQSINNRADADSSDYDPDMSNNWDIAEHEITAVADLALTKEAWGQMLVGCDGATEEWLNEVAAGGTVTYTLTVSNTGPSTAENVVVLDEPLPSPDLLEIEVQSITPSQGSCQTGHIVDQRRLSCNLGTITSEMSATVTFVAHVPSWVPDNTPLDNGAQVYSDMFDDNNGNDIVSNQTVVSRVADLEVGKTQEPVVALPGQDITYTIVVTNDGPSDAQGVIISDTLPVEVLNATWTCCASDGECDVPCEPPVCPPGECPWPDIGLFAQADIPAGELVIYTVEGVLDVWPCPLPITNTVEIIAPLSLVHPELDIDPCDDNNVAEAVNKVPFCTYDPLILKQYPGPDSPP